LHQYANLYFNGRNAMLFRLIHNYNRDKRVPPEKLALLRVSHGVLDLPDVVITDINAAADVEPRWHTAMEALPELVAAEIFASSWDHADPMAKRRHMQRMMAEVLVPHWVSPDHITGTYVCTAEVAAVVGQVAPTLASEVSPYMFFRGSAS
jgi:hypothetical protein